MCWVPTSKEKLRLTNVPRAIARQSASTAEAGVDQPCGYSHAKHSTGNFGRYALQGRGGRGAVGQDGREAICRLARSVPRGSFPPLHAAVKLHDLDSCPGRRIWAIRPDFPPSPLARGGAWPAQGPAGKIPSTLLARIRTARDGKREWNGSPVRMANVARVRRLGGAIVPGGGAVFPSRTPPQPWTVVGIVSRASTPFFVGDLPHAWSHRNRRRAGHVCYTREIDDRIVLAAGIRRLVEV